MADIPERFYEQARSIRNGVIWESNAATRVLAEALYGAWKEGAAEAEAENERLRKALEFYADEDRWHDFESDQMSAAFDRNFGTEFSADMGAAARRALEGGKEDG